MKIQATVREQLEKAEKIASAYLASARQFQNLEIGFRNTDLPELIEKKREEVSDLLNKIAWASGKPKANPEATSDELRRSTLKATNAEELVGQLTITVDELLQMSNDLDDAERDRPVSESAVEEEAPIHGHEGRLAAFADDGDIAPEDPEKEDSNVGGIDHPDNFDSPRRMQILIDDPNSMDEEGEY
jgi:hypothetical protein